MITKSLVAASTKPIVLSILASGEAYGYQIIQRIDNLSGGTMQWTAGALYPLLHRLETQDLISATWRKADSGRERKYYNLTKLGRDSLAAEKKQWLDVNDILIKLWGPGRQLSIG